MRRAFLAHVVLAIAIAVVIAIVLALVGVGALWAILAGLVVGAGVSGVLHVRSDAMALRALGARPMADNEIPSYENLVEGLVVANGFRMPSLWIVDDAAPNAAAVGRTPKHSAIVVTTGLLERMRRIELEGVLAHELTRVRYRESLLGVTTGLLVGPLPTFARAPLAERMLEPGTAVAADLAGVEITRYPPGLAGALEVMRADGRVVKANPRAFRHLWINTPAEAIAEPEFSIGARIDVLQEL